MKNVMRIAAVAAFASLWGCGRVVSIRPLGDASDSVFDAGFVGTWTDKDDTYVVKPGKNNDYEIRDLKNPSAAMSARIFEIGSERVIDFVCTECGPFAIPGHAFARLRRVSDDQVEIRFIDSEWLAQKAKTLGLPWFDYGDPPEVMVLTSPSAQVRDLIANYGLREEALNDAAVLQRLGR